MAQGPRETDRRLQQPRQGRRIRGFEGARAPPEHGRAPSHRQKHPLKMKRKLDETPFQTDIQQSYGFLMFILGIEGEVR